MHCKLTYKYKQTSVYLYTHTHIAICVHSQCPTHCSPPGSQSSNISWSLLKYMSFGLVMLSNQLIVCCPLLLCPFISIHIRVFSNESAVRIRWPKYWSFSFIVSPTDEYSGLISFRIGWFDLSAVQGILKSLLQDCNSKALILQYLAFFNVQLSDPYMTTGNTIA